LNIDFINHNGITANYSCSAH